MKKISVLLILVFIISMMSVTFATGLIFTYNSFQDNYYSDVKINLSNNGYDIFSNEIKIYVNLTHTNRTASNMVQMNLKLHNGGTEKANYAFQMLASNGDTENIKGLIEKRATGWYFIRNYGYANETEIFLCNNQIITDIRFTDGNGTFRNLQISFLENIPYPIPPQNVPNANEYVLITNPPDDYKTVVKYNSYWVEYSIAAAQIPDVKVNIRNQNEVPIADDTNVMLYQVKSHTSQVVNGYVKGQIRLEIQHKNEFTGEAGIQVEVVNTVSNKKIEDFKHITITAFTDANGDGIDDETGDEPYTPPRTPSDFEDGRPNRADYSNDIWGEIQYGFDTLVYFITLPFKYLAESLTFVTNWLGQSMGWITDMSNVFSSIFGFLPPEIVGGMTFLFMIFVVFAVIKMIRG